MCDYEEFLWLCGCSEQRLLSHCHYARNHPTHNCKGVRKLRSVWDQNCLCDRHEQERISQWHMHMQQQHQHQRQGGNGGNRGGR